MWNKSVCMLSDFSCVWLHDHMDCRAPGSSVHGDSPGKNTGVGCHALLQRIFPTQGLNPRYLYLLHWQAGSLQLLPPEKPCNYSTMNKFRKFNIDIPLFNIQYICKFCQQPNNVLGVDFPIQDPIQDSALNLIRRSLSFNLKLFLCLSLSFTTLACWKSQLLSRTILS